MEGIIRDIITKISCQEKHPSFYINGKYYTYSQFGERVSSIRQLIRNLQTTEKLFGLVVYDDIETYASIIALWMEGKAYVPLLPFHPKERNREIVRQVGLTYVIESMENIFCPDCFIINSKRSEFSDSFWVDAVDVPNDELAYILFTSGSTGKPKGVCITRGNVAAFMDSFWKTGISITQNDRCLQCFDLTFDVSVQSFLAPLMRGACVYTVPYGQVKYLYVASLIQKHHLTFGAMAPSMLTYLRPFFAELDASSFKVCILTAEACQIDLLEDWSQCASNADIYDFYGPTEATIYCTCYKFVRAGNNLSSNGIVSIGAPLANVEAIILDENGNMLFSNEKGELCVSGLQVTPGYWNNQEKNATSFFVKEMDGVEKTFYHTGDLCYWDDSGNIMYLGRIDQQAKIQGFRVELSEIEFYAREFFHHEKRVVALAFNNERNLAEIALFVESEEDVDLSDLGDYLREKLPSYMIPSRFMFEPSFPLNGSDKVDRNKLKERLL